MPDPTRTDHRTGPALMAQLAPFLAPPSDAPWPGDQGSAGAGDADLDTPVQLFAVIDAARDPRIFDALLDRQAQLDLASLYQGESAEVLADVAPYLLRLDPACPDCAWLLEQGWGAAWFILVLARGTSEVVRRHLRKFTMVWTEEGRSLLFRFYDPRVLRLFLPTCSPDQLDKLYGEVVLRFFVESLAPDQALMFAWRDGALDQIPIRLAGHRAGHGGDGR